MWIKIIVLIAMLAVLFSLFKGLTHLVKGGKAREGIKVISLAARIIDCHYRLTLCCLVFRLDCAARATRACRRQNIRHSPCHSTLILWPSLLRGS